MKITKTVVDGETEFSITGLKRHELDCVLETLRATSYKPYSADMVSAKLHEAMRSLVQ